jgi:peptide/nickel transport system permease protein
MFAFIVRRLIGMVLVLAVVSFLTFVIFVIIPGGDPAQRIAGKNATAQNIENIRQAWGFNKPFYVQYVDMMNHIFIKRDLKSYTDQTNVIDQMRQGFSATFSLAIGAGIIWLLSGILVGVISAVKAGKAADRGLTVLALVGISMPVFWLGLEVRYYFAETNTWFPDGGYVGLTDNPAQWFYHMILPWLVLAVLFIGVYGRVLRSNILDTINEDYVRTAKAKGLDGRKVMRKHVLRNSLIPIVTLFGLDFAAVIGGGAILTETVFDLNGIGQYAARSVGNLDLPPIMGVVMYGAFFIVLFSAIVDLVYAWLDPRIRPT